MSYIGMGQEPDQLAVIQQQTAEILARQKRESRNRRIAIGISAAAALFAAARLGIIAMPVIKARRRKKLGELGR